MSVHTIKKSKGSKGSRQRIGRGNGSGSGSTSGRGHNGQNSRSGGGVGSGFEGGQMPLFRRIAKRGFSNAVFKTKYAVVNLDDLERCFADSGIVSVKTLVEKGVTKKAEKNVKILADGELKKALTIEGIKVSTNAKVKIEKAGGSVKEIE